MPISEDDDDMTDTVRLVAALHGKANDADAWADSYKGQRQETWMRGFASVARLAATVLEKGPRVVDLGDDAALSAPQGGEVGRIKEKFRAIFERAPSLIDSKTAVHMPISGMDEGHQVTWLELHTLLAASPPPPAIGEEKIARVLYEQEISRDPDSPHGTWEYLRPIYLQDARAVLAVINSHRQTADVGTPGVVNEKS